MKRTKMKPIKRVKLRKPKKHNPSVEELIYLAKYPPHQFNLGAPKAEIDDMSEAERVKFMAYRQKVVEERTSQCSCLENIFEVHEAGGPLEKDQIDVLVQLAKLSPLPAIPGPPPGRPKGPGDPYQRLLQLAVCVLRIGRQEYLAMYSPRQRDWKSACESMAKAAIEVVQSDQPGIQITAKEVLGFKESSSDWVRDHVAMHFANAPELMREQALQLA